MLQVVFNSELIWQSMRSCKRWIFNLRNGCKQFRLQQTWLETRYMDSCDSRVAAF
jgi:hypothetical protein